MPQGMTALGLDPRLQPSLRHGASRSQTSTSLPPAHAARGASSGRSHRMLRVYSFLGLVMLVAGAAMFQPAGPTGQDVSREAVRWVRTRDGWEKAVWLRPSAVYQPRLHPLVVGAGLTLAAVLALLSFPAVPQGNRSQES